MCNYISHKWNKHVPEFGWNGGGGGGDPRDLARHTTLINFNHLFHLQLCENQWHIIFTTHILDLRGRIQIRNLIQILRCVCLLTRLWAWRINDEWHVQRHITLTSHAVYFHPLGHAPKYKIAHNESPTHARWNVLQTTSWTYFMSKCKIKYKIIYVLSLK